MELLKKYAIINYDNNIKRLKKIIVNGIGELNDFIKNQSTSRLRVWIKMVDYTLADNQNYKTESYLLITLVIKLFTMELDVENVSLKNS